MSQERLRCPRCRSVLAFRSAGSRSFQVCHRCGGIWGQRFRSTELASDLGSEALAAATEASLRAQTWDVSAEIACPECEAPLERTQAGKSRIPVDVCREHGVWFDRTEIENIVLDGLGPEAPRAGTGKGTAAAAAAVAGAAALSASTQPAAASSPGVGDAVVETAIEAAIEILGGLIAGIFD